MGQMQLLHTWNWNTSYITWCIL